MKCPKIGLAGYRCDTCPVNRSGECKEATDKFDLKAWRRSYGLDEETGKGLEEEG